MFPSKGRGKNNVHNSLMNKYGFQKLKEKEELIGIYKTN